MTPNLASISSELLRISSYAGVMSQLAKSGQKESLDVIKLQAVFADIANVTEQAYAEVENIIHNECPFIDQFDRPLSSIRTPK